METRTNSSVSLLVKGILLESVLSFSTLAEAKTECFAHLCFNSTLQPISGISIDCQKLRRYLNSTAIVVFFLIELFLSTTVCSDILAL